MTDQRSVSDDAGKSVSISDIDKKAYEIQRRVRDGGLDLKETNKRLQRVAESTDSHFSELPIFLTIYSNSGRTGKEWARVLRDDGVYVQGWTEDVLTQPGFDINHVTDSRLYEPAVINDDELYKDERTTENIRRVGTDERGLVEPPAELGALLAEKLTSSDFRRLKRAYGIDCLIIMHEPITDSRDNPRLLTIGHHDIRVGLTPLSGDPKKCWGDRCGFLFDSSSLHLDA